MPHIPSDGEGDAITSDFVPPKGQEAEQDFIAMCGKLLPGSGLYLFVDTLDDGRANFVGQLRRSEHVPPRGQRSSELFEEMFDATFASAQMKQQIGSHAPPSADPAPSKPPYPRQPR